MKKKKLYKELGWCYHNLFDKELLDCMVKADNWSDNEYVKPKKKYQMMKKFWKGALKLKMLTW